MQKIPKGFSKLKMVRILHPDNFKKIVRNKDGSMNHYNIQMIVMLFFSVHVGAWCLYREITDSEEVKAKRKERTFRKVFEEAKEKENFFSKPLDYNRKTTIFDSPKSEK